MLPVSTDLIFIAVLRLKLWFSGFDNIDFTNFFIFRFSRFLVSAHYFIIDSSLFYYWRSKRTKLNNTNF